MRVHLAALIPAFNEEAVIGQTIESIILAGMPCQDIYLINDGSIDKTAEIAKSFGVNTLNNQKNLGKAGSVANAIMELNLLDRYSHISFLDADTIVDPKYFQAVRNRLSNDLRLCERRSKGVWKRRAIGVLCGKAKSIPHNWLTAFRAYEYWLTHAIHKPAQEQLRVILVAPGCASTYSVTTLQKVMWSDDTVVEDMDTTIQAALAGEKIAYEEKAVVYTQDPRRLRDYVGQIGRRWYPGTWQVMGKHKLLSKGLFSRIHWECRIMTLEPVVYLGSLIWTSWKHPQYLLWMIAVSFAVTVGLALVASSRERRFDIVKFSPIFPLILFLNLLLFVGMSGNIRGKKRTSSRQSKWYSPKRYAIKN